MGEFILEDWLNLPLDKQLEEIKAETRSICEIFSKNPCVSREKRIETVCDFFLKIDSMSRTDLMKTHCGISLYGAAISLWEMAQEPLPNYELLTESAHECHAYAMQTRLPRTY